MRIFVSIASYRDPELFTTLKNALETAKNPEKINFGIVYQGTAREFPDLSFVKNKKIIDIHPKYAKGVGFARSKAMDLYDGEEYFLQIDSHTQFEKNWDELCIKEFSLAKSLSSLTILSAYPLPYTTLGHKGSILLNSSYGNELPVHTMKQALSLRDDGLWGSKRVEFDNPKDLIPEQSSTVLAGFIFSDGDIVEKIPYDPEISFFGEEACFAMRSWTRGYDIYSPKSKILYHHYTRPYAPKIWKERAIIREKSWDELQRISYDKQERVLCGIESGIFGAGDKRKLSEFESFTGYDFNKFYSTIDKKIGT